MTDSRTNAPTDERVEAAAKALRADEGFMAEVHSALEVSWSEYVARLVLTAAHETTVPDAAPDGQVIIPIARIHELRAAKDAALAAIERIRAIHERDMVLRDYCSECSDFGSDQFPPGQMVEWPCPTIQALDGAPEPEVKP